MEFEALSHIHIIKEADNAPVPAVGCTYSLIFDLSSAERIDLCFRHIFLEQTMAQFSVTLRPGKAYGDTDWKWLDKLCLILCHPAYFKLNNQLLLGILYDQLITEDSGFLVELEQKLITQGFSISFFPIRSDKGSEKSTSCCVYDKHIPEVHFKAWYLDRLVDSAGRLNIFAALTDSEKLFKLKDAAEKELFEEHNLEYRLIQRLQAKEADLHQCKGLIEMLSEDLASKRNYLDFLLGKFKDDNKISDTDFSEIMKVKRFYYREYEVLPLWYKRLGHIIKVVTGKRSFRSLFDDKLKDQQ